MEFGELVWAVCLENWRVLAAIGLILAALSLRVCQSARREILLGMIWFPFSIGLLLCAYALFFGWCLYDPSGVLPRILFPLLLAVLAIGCGAGAAIYALLAMAKGLKTKNQAV